VVIQSHLFGSSDWEWRPKRPDAFDILGELRAPLELLAFPFRALRHPWPRAASGEGKLVMLIPGFMAGDITLSPMARFFRWLGHRTEFCGIWSNARCPRATIDHLSTRLREISDREGCPVVVVGQSLGGVYARELAWRDPERVERVVTLGAPINSPRASCHGAVRALADSIAALRGRREGCITESCSCGLELSRRRAQPVPVTVVYSRTDGVVHWESCIDQTGSAQVDHVEVMGSHVGMAISPDVFRIVADRLAMPRPETRPPATRDSRVIPLRRAIVR
jgi:triacylglycerol lipase